MFAAPGASWNERADLAADLASLHEDDMVGALAVLYHHRGPVVETETAMGRGIRADLDAASSETLVALQNYVARCKGGTKAHPASMCAVCHGQWSPHPVVRCATETCENGVHPSCYGEVVVSSPYTPWQCWDCSPEAMVAKFCTLCGLALGLSARKCAENRQAVHIECVTYTPEARLGTSPTLEPVTIDRLDSIPPWRTSRACSICFTEGGVTLSCDAGECESAFHAFCAVKAEQAVAVDGDPLSVWCEEHKPKPNPGVPLLHSFWQRLSSAPAATSLPAALPLVTPPSVKLLPPVDVDSDFVYLAPTCCAGKACKPSCHGMS